MTGIRVTNEAVDAAIAVMYPHVSHSDPIGTRAHVTRILEAAAAHLVDDRVTAALELHYRICGRCGERTCQCSPSAEGRQLWICYECWRPTGPAGMGGGEPWPCPTARALGATS